MKLLYLDSSRRDVAWWRRYYGGRFPQGAPGAYRHLRKTAELLKKNPYLGSSVEDTDLRKLTIPHTPFLLIYRIEDDIVQIVRVWDSRQNPEAGFQEE